MQGMHAAVQLLAKPGTSKHTSKTHLSLMLLAHKVVGRWYAAATLTLRHASIANGVFIGDMPSSAIKPGMNT